MKPEYEINLKDTCDGCNGTIYYEEREVDKNVIQLVPICENCGELE